MSATFRQLFPDSFDRAIPVIKHQAIDKLLIKLDSVMWKYEQAVELLRSRGGGKLTRRTGFCGLWGRQVDVLQQYKENMLKIQEEVRQARKRALEEGSTPSW